MSKRQADYDEWEERVSKEQYPGRRYKYHRRSGQKFWIEDKPKDPTNPQAEDSILPDSAGSSKAPVGDPSSSLQRSYSAPPSTSRSVLRGARIIEQAKLILRVKDCKNVRTSESECPDNLLVDIDEPIQSALKIIMENVDKEGSCSARVAPLMFTRLARGGKTTFLRRLFDAVKLTKDYLPILISFSGDYQRAVGEPQLDALIRQLSTKFMVPPPVKNDNISYVYNRDDLIDHIDSHCDNGRVILLIDQLNALSNGIDPIDADSAGFLKSQFLDRAGRYLVFTSHIPLDVDITKEEKGLSNYMTSPKLSGRGCFSVRQPHCSDVQVLRQMPGCSSLTPAEAVILGGIPSLVYTSKTDVALPLEQRFSRQGIALPPGKEEEILQQFITDVLVGELEFDRYVPFFCFASMPAVGTVWWPLCYIACILQLFRRLKHVQFKKEFLHPFKVHASRVGPGPSRDEWAIIVHAALVFRCIDAMVNGTRGPFGIADLDACPKFLCHTVPGEIDTHTQARDHIHGVLRRTAPGTIVLFSLSFSSYPDYDGYVGYHSSAGDMRVIGHQEKTGRDYPTVDAQDWVYESYLVRGDAALQANKKKGWKYMSEDEILGLLGFSLSTLYPKKWSTLSAQEVHESPSLAL